MVIPLFCRTVFTATGLLNFIPLPVILVVCLVLLHTLFYFVILHADVDSPVLAWHISELLWTWGVLNCPENAVCHGWWETYFVCISCHMNMLRVCLCGFCTCDGRAVLTDFYLVGCFMVSSSGMESCVTAWESTHSPWKLWDEPVWCVVLLHPRCLHSVLMLGWCCISGPHCCVV
jgi:hypothetical protein